MAQSKMRTQSASRTEVLIQHDLLGAFIEADFQELVELGKTYFGVSICAVSIVGERSQCFKGIVGFDAESTPVEIAFCAHTILSDGVMVVLDATQDPRFAANPLVIGVPGIRFYAGAPITTKEGDRVGAYCIIVIDRVVLSVQSSDNYSFPLRCLPLSEFKDAPRRSQPK